MRPRRDVALRQRPSDFDAAFKQHFPSAIGRHKISVERSFRGFAFPPLCSPYRSGGAVLQRLKNSWAIGLVIAALLLVAARWSQSNADVSGAPESDQDPGSTPPSSPGETGSSHKIRVDVVRPHMGGMSLTDTEPGNVDAFDYANLYAKISGYLKVLNVDIGSVVKQGQVLAEIDAPEYVQSRDEAQAEVEQAKARVQLAESAVTRAQADVGAAEAGVEEKKAALTRAEAYLNFRKIQFGRMTHLYELKSIDQRLVEESRKERDAAQAAVDAIETSIHTAQAEVTAKKAKVVETQAGVADARAKVDVAQALLQKAQVFVDYLKIVSPYNGVITERGFHVGDFIRSPEEGRQVPLLTVARTDVMRVVTKVPERYVPYCEPGDPATVELDALHGRVFHGKVSRIANSLDRADRTMRVEVDLKNTADELRDGMFGRVTIQLTSGTKELSVPSSALVNAGGSGSFSVYVVRNGHADLVPVKVGRDNGILAEVLSGLQPDDVIVAHPTEDLRSGVAVEFDEPPPATPSGTLSKG
jgi:HlyD family secretion protein